MSGSDSITIVMPALNEASGLEAALNIVLAVLPGRSGAYEVLLFDDGSTDGTGVLADRLAAAHPGVVQAFHHQQPHGLGATIREGYARARMDHVIWVDGKGATTAEGLDAICARRGEADLVIPWPTNQSERPWFRRVISRAFVSLLNALFGLHLPYYTAPALCRADLARAVPSRSASHAFQAELLIQLLLAGCSHVVVPIRDNFAFDWRHTSAFRPANVAGVASFLLRTLWTVYRPGGRARLRAAVDRARRNNQHATPDDNG